MDAEVHAISAGDLTLHHVVQRYPLEPGLWLTLTPVADAYVDEALPIGNNGATSTIRALKGTGTSQSSYLRFNVTGLNRAVQSAKLRLFVTNPSLQSGGSMYSVSNNYKTSASPWLENGVNWNNAPAIGGAPHPWMPRSTSRIM